MGATTSPEIEEFNVRVFVYVQKNILIVWKVKRGSVLGVDSGVTLGSWVGDRWGGGCPEYDLILDSSLKWFVYSSCGAGELEPGQLRVEVLFIIFPPVGSHERPLEMVAARRPRSKGSAGGVRQTHSKLLRLPGGL